MQVLSVSQSLYTYVCYSIQAEYSEQEPFYKNATYDQYDENGRIAVMDRGMVLLTQKVILFHLAPLARCRSRR